jgi:hypothetical protein
MNPLSLSVWVFIEIRDRRASRRCNVQVGENWFEKQLKQC